MSTVMVFIFPVAVIALVFTFTAVVHWVDSQRKEREAFYKSETLRRITEASGEGAKAAVELLREDERLKAIKARESIKIAGLINVSIGIAMMIVFGGLFGFGGGSIQKGELGSVYLCGLIPECIGIAMLVYVYLLAPKAE